MMGFHTTDVLAVNDGIDEIKAGTCCVASVIDIMEYIVYGIQENKNAPKINKNKQNNLIVDTAYAERTPN